jgi:hypothetical protein
VIRQARAQLDHRRCCVALCGVEKLMAAAGRTLTQPRITSIINVQLADWLVADGNPWWSVTWVIWRSCGGESSAIIRNSSRNCGLAIMKGTGGAASTITVH